MCTINSLDCRNFARGIRNFNRRMWESVAKDICRPGIQAKFMQNPDLLQILVEKTSNKTVVESANDRLWGTGVPLARDGCLDKERWISPGILGELLMEIRENQTMIPPMVSVKPYPATTATAPTLLGVTNSSLLEVTPSDTPVALLHSATSPSTNTNDPKQEIAVSQDAKTGTMQLKMDHPSMAPEPTHAKQDQLALNNLSTTEANSAMEIS